MNMRSKERIQLTKWEWFYHYNILGYLITALLFIGFSIYEYLISGTQIISNDYYKFLLVYFSIAIFFYWWNWTKLFFEQYHLKISSQNLERVVDITAKELDWQFYKGDGDFYQGFRQISFIGRTRITIKKTDDTLLINSIRNPEYRNGALNENNLENINIFLANLNNIRQGKDAVQLIEDRQTKKEEAFWAESEWSIKMILMRIVGYGLTLFFLLVGLFMIFFEDGSSGLMGGLLFILTGGGFGYNYIKNDIEVLREKSRRKRTNTDRPEKKREHY